MQWSRSRATPDERRQHLYLLQEARTGKSEALKDLLLKAIVETIADLKQAALFGIANVDIRSSGESLKVLRRGGEIKIIRAVQLQSDLAFIEA